MIPPSELGLLSTNIVRCYFLLVRHMRDTLLYYLRYSAVRFCLACLLLLRLVRQWSKIQDGGPINTFRDHYAPRMDGV